ncbi:hypothetical protein P3L10_008516 [Capsicum annuum]
MASKGHGMDGVRKEYENGEKECPFIDVNEKTHRKKNKDGTRGDWVETRAKNAYEEFQKSIEEWCQTQLRGR